MTHESMDHRLQRIKRQTDAIWPSDGFSGRVMGCVGLRPRDVWLDHALAASPWVLAVAAGVALVAGLFAFQVERTTDFEAALAFGTVESSW